MIGTAIRQTGAALQLIDTSLIFDMPPLRIIGVTPRLTGDALQLIGTTLISDIPPLRQ